MNETCDSMTSPISVSEQSCKVRHHHGQDRGEVSPGAQNARLDESRHVAETPRARRTHAARHCDEKREE